MASPFKTIQQAATTMVAGDICYIRGGTYRESVTFSRSGSAGRPITLAAYGSEKCIVSGADLVTGWYQSSGSIYKASMNWTLRDENQVFIGGKMATLSRWPNDVDNDPVTHDGAMVESGSATSLRDAELSRSTTNYWRNGIVWAQAQDKWTCWGATITSSSGSDIFFTIPGDSWIGAYHNPGVTSGTDKNYYYISGIMNEIDAPREWCLDSVAQQLYLYFPLGTTPNITPVEAKKRLYAFVVDQSYIRIVNVGIFAAAVKISGSNCAIEGMDGKYLYHHSSRGMSYDFPAVWNNYGCVISGSNDTIRSSSFSYSAGYGLQVLGTNNVVDNCVLDTIDYLGNYGSAINLDGNNNRATRNTARYCGSAVITFSYGGHRILYNDCGFGEQLGDDRGGINGGAPNATYAQNIVAYNWIHDIGKNLASGFCPGLYTDVAQDNVTYHHNIVWNLRGKDGAVRVNNSGSGDGNNNIFIYNNTGYALPGATFVMAGHGGTFTESNSLQTATSSLFVNAGAGDFRLVSGANSAIDQGSVISTYTNGYAGAKPDLGAYEFNGAAPVSSWQAGINCVMHFPDGLPTNVTPTNTTRFTVEQATAVSAPQLHISNLGSFGATRAELYVPFKGESSVRLFSPQGKLIESMTLSQPGIVSFQRLSKGVHLVVIMSQGHKIRLKALIY